MTFSTINVSTPNSGLGDKLRDAFVKVNNNFSLITDQVTISYLTATLSNYATKVYVEAQDVILDDKITTLEDRVSGHDTDIDNLNSITDGLTNLLNAKADLSQLNNSITAVNGSIAAQQIVIDTKIGEAPVNGLSYVRKNSSWVLASGGYTKLTCLIEQRQDNTVADITEGPLEIGRTYRIISYSTGDDFTNVGDNQNTEGRNFIATGTTPTNWSNGSILQYTIGAPILTVLENDIPNPIYCAYQAQGIYNITTYVETFTTDKVVIFYTSSSTGVDASTLNFTTKFIDEKNIYLYTKDTDGVLFGASLEVRIYN